VFEERTRRAQAHCDIHDDAGAGRLCSSTPRLVDEESDALVTRLWQSQSRRRLSDAPTDLGDGKCAIVVALELGEQAVGNPRG
jgi:hypothetical protein